MSTNRGVYLVVKHDGSLGPSGDEYVGPFDTWMQAYHFQEEHGPGLAKVKYVVGHPPAEFTMTQAECLAYLAGRD